MYKPLPEVRKFSRAPLATRVNCLGPGTFFSDFTINVSEGGMMLQAISEVRPGTELEVQFSIPGSGKVIKAVAEVVWTRKNPRGEAQIGVGLGVRFKRIERDEQATIRRFVETQSA